jgi:diguanylate cyclase (GGDEF)-like protein
VLVSVTNISDIEHRYGVEGKNGALVNVGSQLRGSVRQYDIVARFDDSTFALLLADTIANDAFLWAEKVRGSISSSIITVDKKSFSVSVTIGVSGAAARMPGEELLKNASFVLDQAKRAGGNIVRVF